MVDRKGEMDDEEIERLLAEKQGQAEEVLLEDEEDKDEEEEEEWKREEEELERKAKEDKSATAVVEEAAFNPYAGEGAVVERTDSGKLRPCKIR